MTPTSNPLARAAPWIGLGALLSVIRVLGLSSKLLTALDPYESDLGRASADRALPQRVRRR